MTKFASVEEIWTQTHFKMFQSIESSFHRNIVTAAQIVSAVVSVMPVLAPSYIPLVKEKLIFIKRTIFDKSASSIFSSQLSSLPVIIDCISLLWAVELWWCKSCQWLKLVFEFEIIDCNLSFISASHLHYWNAGTKSIRNHTTLQKFERHKMGRVAIKSHPWVKQKQEKLN